MDGVPRLDLEKRDDCEPLKELTGGNREGTVPARVRRVELGVEAEVEPAVA